MEIAIEVLEVLQNGEVEGDLFRITSGQLDRKLYQAVDSALNIMGGKWDRRRQGHVFPSALQADALFSVIERGLLVDPKINGFFEIPPAVLELMINRAQLRAGLLVLEPSAGRGAIIDAAWPIVGSDRVWWCELLPENIAYLQESGHRKKQVGTDFLALSAKALQAFDRVLMNPPFGSGGDSYVEHIQHATEFVRPGGTVVSVAPAGLKFRTDRKIEKLRAKIESWQGTIEALPADAFKSSGTGVNTVLVTMKRPFGR